MSSHENSFFFATFLFAEFLHSLYRAVFVDCVVAQSVEFGRSVFMLDSLGSSIILFLLFGSSQQSQLGSEGHSIELLIKNLRIFNGSGGPEESHFGVNLELLLYSALKSLEVFTFFEVDAFSFTKTVDKQLHMIYNLKFLYLAILLMLCLWCDDLSK